MSLEISVLKDIYKRIKTQNLLATYPNTIETDLTQKPS